MTRGLSVTGVAVVATRELTTSRAQVTRAQLFVNLFLLHEFAGILDGTHMPEHLSANARPTASQLRDREALLACGCHVRRAAAHLGITHGALHKRLRANAQIRWWLATQEKARKERKSARYHREYEQRKQKLAENAGQAYLDSLVGSGTSK